MASNLPTSGDVETVVKTAQTYVKDLVERVVWTFLAAAAGVALAAGPGDMLNVTFWETVGTAGIAAVGSLLAEPARTASGGQAAADEQMVDGAVGHGVRPWARRPW